jgi:hypothetical protein
MKTKRNLPTTTPGHEDQYPIQGSNGHTNTHSSDQTPAPVGKSLYLPAGFGIAEIETILSDFVIPNFLDFKVKAVGSIFSVSTGMFSEKKDHFSTSAPVLPI